MKQQMHQLVFKNNGVLFSREIAALPAPFCNRDGHASNKLAHTRFAFRTPLFAMEIFGSDDIGGRHGPRLRHFHVLLFKNDFAGFIRDASRPVLPFDRVVRGDILTGEISPELQALFRFAQAPVSIGFSFQDFLFHVLLPPYIVLFETDYAR